MTTIEFPTFDISDVRRDVLNTTDEYAQLVRDAYRAWASDEPDACRATLAAVMSVMGYRCPVPDAVVHLHRNHLSRAYGLLRVLQNRIYARDAVQAIDSELYIPEVDLTPGVTVPNGSDVPHVPFELSEANTVAPVTVKQAILDLLTERKQPTGFGLIVRLLEGRFTSTDIGRALETLRDVDRAIVYESKRYSLNNSIAIPTEHSSNEPADVAMSDSEFWSNAPSPKSARATFFRRIKTMPRHEAIKP